MIIEDNGWPDLQEPTLLILLLLCQECGAGGMFENLTDTFICLGRTFEVFVGSDFLAHLLTLVIVRSLVLMQKNKRPPWRYSS